MKYPGESGLQFRFVAEAAGLGRVGTNAFLFHPAWGPWVHLRVMATTAELEVRPKLSGEQFVTTAVSAFRSVRRKRSQPTCFKDSGADRTVSAEGSTIRTVLMASCRTANDVSGFVRRGNMLFRVQAMRGRSNQALHGDAVTRAHERHVGRGKLPITLLKSSLSRKPASLGRFMQK